MTYRDIARKAPLTFLRNRVRLVTVDDPQDLIALVDACSPESRFLRFHTGMATLRPAMAEQLAQTPGLGLRNWRGRLIADARYTRTGPDEAEVAILVADRYQGRGLGLALLAVLYVRAADEGIHQLSATVLNSNAGIIGLLEKLTAVETVGVEDGARRLRLPLEPMSLAA